MVFCFEAANGEFVCAFVAVAFNSFRFEFEF